MPLEAACRLAWRGGEMIRYKIEMELKTIKSTEFTRLGY